MRAALQSKTLLSWVPLIKVVKPEARERRQLLFGAIGALVVVSGLGTWIWLSPETFQRAAREDGPVENLTALFFLLAAVLFLVFAKRSSFLAAKESRLAYVFVLGWAALVFACAGEEASWGQRILGFETPQVMVEDNRQDEFNIHNGKVLEFLIGRHGWRAISILTIATGLLLPIAAQTVFGRRMIQRLCLPVCPLAYSFLFVGSYFFEKFFHEIAYYQKPAQEMRELLLAAGFLLFALHGAARPGDLFRVTKD